MEFILKSSLLIGIFYSFYKLFLQKETFFKSIRVYFIIGLIITLVFPLIIIPIYIEPTSETLNFIPQIIENKAIAANNFILDGNTTIASQEVIAKNENPFNWLFLLKNIYLLGILFFSFKFIIEIFSLYRLVHKSNQLKKGKITFAETLKNISPFSIFNYIVYNKNLFDKTELLQIIEHEKVHVNHKHSYDMLLVHLLVIVQWFNPFAWLYKKDVEQNLEFLADKFAQENHDTLKEYQYLLLKTSIQKNPFALSTNFYNSLIKKRIIMLQKNPSKKLNQLKYLLILPLIAVFLFAFNTREFVKPTFEEVLENSPQIKNIKTTNPFINPLETTKIKKISSGFGKRVNPFTKKEQFHKGIDLIAPTNTKVYATKDGEVLTSTYHTKKGNYIQIKHNDQFQTNYHHLNILKIKKGDKVVAGDIIGTVGSTGKSTGSHLHYEIVKEGKNVNPITYFKVKNNLVITNQHVTNSVSEKKTIKIIINKSTTASELEQIKKDLEKEGLKVSFKKVKRNKQNEITSIKISASNKNSKVNYQNSNDEGINDITLKFENDVISIGDNNTIHHNGDHNIFVYADSDHKHKKHKKHKKNKKHKIFVSTDEESGSHSDIFVVESDDENATYIVNGKKMSKEEFEKMDKKDIQTIEIESNTTNHSGKKNKFIFVTEDEDVDDDGQGSKTVKKIKITKHHDGNNNSFYYEIDSDDDDENTVTTYTVNGKKMTKEEFEKFDKSKIRDLKVEKRKEVIKKED